MFFENKQKMQCQFKRLHLFNAKTKCIGHFSFWAFHKYSGHTRRMLPQKCLISLQHLNRYMALIAFSNFFEHQINRYFIIQTCHSTQYIHAVYSGTWLVFVNSFLLKESSNTSKMFLDWTWWPLCSRCVILQSTLALPYHQSSVIPIDYWWIKTSGSDKKYQNHGFMQLLV